MDVEIIAIGDELLIGQVVDTNSPWISKKLNESGFKITRKTIVGDNEIEIIAAIEEAKERSNIVLVTGGLGPTKDDITLQALCNFFNCQLHFSKDVYEHIQKLFSKNGRKLNELTAKQAMVPDQCTIIQNQVGTAPCTWFQKEDFLLVSMPGVPFEMKWLMENEIIPRLKKQYLQNIYIKHQTFWVNGYSESDLAIRLNDFEEQLPPFIKLAYLPQYGIIRLRLSAYTSNKEQADFAILKLQNQLKEILGKHIFSIGEKQPEEVIGDELRKYGMTIGTAESCTGGSIAALLTSIPGSSDYFMGSIVSYSNKVKQNILGVADNDLVKYGAVSQQVVEQMAKGAKQVLGTDYAIATSGIAGPGGGTSEKPVGTIWIAISSNKETISRQYQFNSNRQQNIQRTALMSILLLLDQIKKELQEMN